MQPLTVPEVRVEDLHKSFDSKPVLNGVDLSVPRGQLIAIVGGSGCGKTVLLKHLTAHFMPDRGRVLVADHEAEPTDDVAPLRDLTALDDRGLDALRTHWAMVFQRNALLSGNVFDNLALWPREIKRADDETIKPQARKALLDVGLDPDQILHRNREALSGGMAKRVAIARALMMDPVLILYDEPTAGLDPEMCVQIHSLIETTHRTQPALARSRQGVVRTSIIVTHDTHLLQHLRPRVVMLHAGRVHFDGSFEAFADSPDPHILPYIEQMAFLHHR